MSRKDTYWLKDSVSSDPTEWIPITAIVPTERRLMIGTGIRVRFDCPGKYGGEFQVQGGLFWCYPSEPLLRELFEEEA